MEVNGWIGVVSRRGRRCRFRLGWLGVVVAGGRRCVALIARVVLEVVVRVAVSWYAG